MTFKQELINALPPFTNTWELVKRHQGTGDIIKEIQTAHNMFVADYDLIYDFFNTGNIYNTCKKIWEFEKFSLSYAAEGGADQTTASPTVILHEGEYCDCKHYALFCAGLLNSIKEAEGDKYSNNSKPWDWFFRFASDKDVNQVTHVFVVVVDHGNEIWIDPCLTNFDQRKKYLIIKDIKPMALYRRISGVSDIVPDKTVVVDKQAAFRSFLTFLSKDMFSQTPKGKSLIKTLMLQYPEVTNGAVKQYFLSQGFNWDMFERFLNS